MYHFLALTPNVYLVQFLCFWSPDRPPLHEVKVGEKCFSSSTESLTFLSFIIGLSGKVVSWI